MARVAHAKFRGWHTLLKSTTTIGGGVVQFTVAQFRSLVRSLCVRACVRACGRACVRAC